MPIVETRGQRIHWQTHGDPRSPPLLLVMGLGLSSAAWDTLPERGAKSRYIVTFDNRGTGGSSLPTRPYRMRDLADDAAAVLDAAGLARADVLGVSMGGMIAQELVLRHPERVRRLALACTFSSWLKSKKSSPRVLVDLLRALAGRGRDAGMARMLVSQEWYGREGSPAAFRRWRENGERGRARRALFQLLAVALHETTGRLGQIRVPTLILTGDDDRLVDWRNSHRLARTIPGARLLVFPGAGHVFPLEREEEMLRELEEFFAWDEPVAQPARAGGGLG